MESELLRHLGKARLRFIVVWSAIISVACRTKEGEKRAELQGAYFANWKASKMVIPYAEVGAQWWDAHFLSLDYGFGKSSASAHLHVRTQDGRIKTVGEFVAPHLPAYEFAHEVVRRLVAPTTQGQSRKIVAVYLDPANFKNIGDGHTIADQINEVLEPYDLGVIAASNDRIGGWQLMYQMLQTGQWKIADTCRS